MICFLTFSILWGISAPGAVPLPSSILHVKQVVDLGDHMIVLDGIAKALWKISKDGALKGSYQRGGTGPGEFISLWRIRLINDRLYILDILKRSVIVLDTDFEFLEEIKTKGMCRDLHREDNTLFLVYWDGQSRKMVHPFRNSEPAGESFGFGLSGRMFGFQSAELLEREGKLLYLHDFMPWLDVYDKTGKLLQRQHLPGFEKPFISMERIEKRQRYFRYSLPGLILWDEDLFVMKRDYELHEAWLYRYDLAQNRFVERRSCPWSTVWDRRGRLYEIVINQDGDPIQLRPLKKSR